MTRKKLIHILHFWRRFNILKIVRLIVIFVGVIVFIDIIYSYYNIDFKRGSNIVISELQEKYNNRDIKFVLNVLNTDIYEPVVQGDDNKYYLKHNLRNDKNLEGSIFMDYRNSVLDNKVLIYGHNSTYVYPPFRELERFYDYDYYDEHKYIELINGEQVIRYIIFSVFVEYEDWSYMNVNLVGDEWLKHLEYLKSKSWYDYGIELYEEDSILILQTCSHMKEYSKYKDKYLLVIGKKI